MTAPPYLKVWMTAPPSSQGLDDSPPLYQGLDDRPPLSQGLDPPLLLPNVFTEENGLMSLQIISKLFISLIKLV